MVLPGPESPEPHGRVDFGKLRPWLSASSSALLFVEIMGGLGLRA